MRVAQAPTREKGGVPPHARILISEPTAAELLSVSLPTFRRWVRLGLIAPVELPGGKDGGGLRRNLYRRGDVQALADRFAADAAARVAGDDRGR